MSMREWARKNNLEERWNQYVAAAEEIAEELAAEGYPGHGSNFELQLEDLQRDFPEFFG